MKKKIPGYLAAALVYAFSAHSQSQAPANKPYSVSGKRITSFVTAQNTDMRISLAGTTGFSPFKQPPETQVCVFVDPAKMFQSFIGIGGAITDAAAETFAKLPAAKQREVLTAYYDKENGIGYTVARTNINSCDFSSENYTYVAENDAGLKTFDIGADRRFKIPLIKAAMNAAGGKLNLFVSPWSPPAWMKDNNDMLHGGKLKPSSYQPWANYYVKFIKAYEKEGIPVWGLTVQNEPMAKQRWESCIYTAEEERDFVKNFLGPTLQMNGLGSKKLMAWDHNRDLIYQRAAVVFGDPGAEKYIWGLAYHWYETWTGSAMQFDNLRAVAETFPKKNLFFTEGCAEVFNSDRLQNWGLGEKYGYSMIHDFNSGTVGWTDWNILLDEKGGPNHVGNYCFAPVHADTNTGNIIYTNSYYYIGHFSKFIKPGARRIVSSSNRDKLQTTAFLNPDGTTVVVVLNTTADRIAYKVCISGEAADEASEPHSIATLLIR